MSVKKHEVFVLSTEGQPLTPTTWRKAKQLLKAGVAKKTWSKFGTFGIQMLVATRHETPLTSLGIDDGTKYNGYAVVCGNENVLAVKWDMPDKQLIGRKLEERRTLRRARRSRHCRRRPARFRNRRRQGFIAPSQLVIVNSRMKALRELYRLYPISRVGFEDVRFNHAKRRWGANFSTVEIGKTRIKNWLSERSQVFEYEGWETEDLREKYGYRKTSVKSADKFTAHCSDALALAVDVGIGQQVDEGRFIVVDDSYRCVRRKLHDTQFAKGGIREDYSRGTVFGLRKGLLVGTPKRTGQLCGKMNRAYRYYDWERKRHSSKKLSWVSAQFKMKEVGNSPAA